MTGENRKEERRRRIQKDGITREVYGKGTIWVG